MVVIGLGALGLLAVKMAHESGAETLVAVDPMPERRALALKYGATAVLDPKACDVGLEVHRLTGGKGADIVIELSGVVPALTDAIRSVRISGTVCSAGFYQTDAQGVWLGREFHHNRLTMIVPHGCGWGHPPRDTPRWDTERAYAAIASLMQQGRLDVPGLINYMPRRHGRAQVRRVRPRARRGRSSLSSRPRPRGGPPAPSVRLAHAA